MWLPVVIYDAFFLAVCKVKHVTNVLAENQYQKLRDLIKKFFVFRC